MEKVTNNSSEIRTISPSVPEEKQQTEVKMNMSDKLATIIHNSYAFSAQQSSINAVEVEENLLQVLNTIQLSDKDELILDYFLDKLSKSILARGGDKTFQSTNICTDILHICMYIVAWLNEKYQAEIDVNITARRKALESELAKMLSLADKLDPTQIMDRFGIRFVLDSGINKCCFLLTKIVNVLCNLNRQDRREFLEYLKKFDDYTQYRIQKILEMPMTLEPLSRKGSKKEFDPKKYPDIELPTAEDWDMVKHLSGNMKYYFEPKWNGYQSIHIILAVGSLPGLVIEIQFRTWLMDQHAENDINASHDLHKDEVKPYTQIFTLSKEELKKTRIRFFNSYRNEQNDKDGIHFPKGFYDRRMNNISL